MKIIMVAVTSINGKTTKDADANIYKWTSGEDKKLFFSQIAKNNLIVMGSKTYEAARDKIKLQSNKLRIVLTKNPKKYLHETIKGGLEFSSESPKDLVKRLEQEGYSQMLMVGGGEINSLFLKNNLVDELHLTIEPFIFSKGRDLVAEDKFDIFLRLISIKKLNAKGTLCLRYNIIKD